MKQEFVSWKIFIWAIAIILGLFSICFSMVASAQVKADSCYNNLYQMRTDIEVIKTDVSWIKDNI